MKKQTFKFGVKRKNDFIRLAAWCNGKAYQKPTHFIIVKTRKGWAMEVHTGGTYLLDFPLRTRTEVGRAYRIVMKQLSLPK